MKPAVAIAGAIAFLGVLIAYVVLVVTDHADQANGLAPLIVTVLGVTGLAGHIEKRTQEQNQVIAKIDRQTNGVLTERIHTGTKAAVEQLLIQHNLIPADQAGKSTD